MPDLQSLKPKFEAVWGLLDERTRRLMAANEALSLGRGGIALVHRASGLSRKAISKGIIELQSGTALSAGRVRRGGAGRKSLLHHNPELAPALEQLVGEEARDDPQSPLLWTCKSTRVLARQP